MRVVVCVVVAVLMLAPRAALAQAAGRTADQSPVFIDVNVFGVANAMAGARDFSTRFLIYGELGSLRAAYPAPSLATLFPILDVGGGVMVRRSLGFGVSYGRASYEDVADLTATVPHPTFLNAAATGTRATDEPLAREEAATHIFVAWVPLRTGRVELRFFGGPSFFSYTARMVTDISYTQTFDPLTPQNTVTITGFSSEDAKGNGAGLHFGGDIAYFFASRVGVTGGVRVSRGTVTLDREPLSEISQDIRVGSTLFLVGVRVRVGG